MAVLLWRSICGRGPEQSFNKNRGASASAPSLGKRSKYSGQSVKAMPMRLLTVGKKRSRGTQLLVDEYKEKLGYYCDFEDTLIRSNPKLTSDVKVQVEAEDTAMMLLLKSDDFVVVLDENGKDVISEQIADLIGDAGNTGSSRLTFCIGGPYGLGLRVRACRYNSQAVLTSFEPSSCFDSPNGAALQGMDYNKRTEVSPLDLCAVIIRCCL